jgi:AcrR family transcriptional regulator
MQWSLTETIKQDNIHTDRSVFYVEVSLQPRSVETREKILRAAEKLFAHNGYEGAGVAEICQAAGVSKGAFYHHFSSKHAVFDTLLNVWLEGLDLGLAAVRQDPGTVPEMLMHMSTMLDQVFQAADGRLPIFLEFWAQASRKPEIWKTTIAPYQRYQAFFTSIVEKGIQEGSLLPVDPPAAARVIVSMAVGVLLQGLLDPAGADWQQVTRQSIQFLIQGLAVKENK